VLILPGVTKSRAMLAWQRSLDPSPDAVDRQEIE
jgi:hypothetical protein